MSRSPSPAPRTSKSSIPKALREQVWRNHMGAVFEGKCLVRWCTNKITVFDFEVGHNIPESKGGATDLGNLRPICARCNKSMANNYTIDDWNKLGAPATVPRTCCGCLG
jgi:5-methylcytosine-specific restriction endonuclease McrA